MTALDTTAAARRVQVSVYRRMDGARRVRLAANLSDDLRKIVAAGVRARHSEWSEARVRHEVLARIYGRELVERVRDSAPSPA